MFCVPFRPLLHGTQCSLLWIGLATVLWMGLTAPATQAQRARAVVSADSVRIGERFLVSLSVTHRFNTSVIFPSTDADPGLFGDMEVLDRSAVAERYLGSDAPGMRVDSVAYEVTTFALDTARIPALPVQVVAGADTITLATRPLQVAVTSTVPPDAQGVRDLAPLATFPGPRWPWVLLALVAIVLVAGLIYLWRHRAEDDAPVPPSPRTTPQQPPYEAAVQRLNTLEQHTDWSDPSALEVFFVEVSMTLRRYVAARLDVAALERTTDELIRDLRRRTVLPTEAVDLLDDVLTRADLVKFADKRPTGREGHAALDTARTTLDALERALPDPPAPEDSPTAHSARNESGPV